MNIRVLLCCWDFRWDFGPLTSSLLQHINFVAIPTVRPAELNVLHEAAIDASAARCFWERTNTAGLDQVSTLFW